MDSEGEGVVSNGWASRPCALSRCGYSGSGDRHASTIWSTQESEEREFLPNWLQGLSGLSVPVCQMEPLRVVVRVE